MKTETAGAGLPLARVRVIADARHHLPAVAAVAAAEEARRFDASPDLVLLGPEKNEIWAGVEPASLFRSRDGGDSWEMVPGISNHAHARKWQPGAGGLCMHTILRDGNRVHLGISTGGHRSEEPAS